MEKSDWLEEKTRSKAMPLRRTKSSRRERNRKAEEDAQQRLTGDAHWSKLLHVNPSDDDMRLVRRLSGKDKEAKQRSAESSRDRDQSSRREGGGGGCFGGGEELSEGTFINGSSAEGPCSVRVINHRPRYRLLAAVRSRIRRWLGSRRKYEISPRDSVVNASATGDPSQPGKQLKELPLKENVFEVDAALNRCGAGHLNPRIPERLPNGYAVAAAAETGKIPLQKSPVSRRHGDGSGSPSTPSTGGTVPGTFTQTTGTSPQLGTASKLTSGAAGMTKSKSKSPVDIKIEVVDVSGHCPSPLSPSASRLLASSRRHLLRQSRSKLKERGVLVTSLVPTGPGLTHQPLTTTISCPPQSNDMAGMVSDIALRRIHSWPLLRRKAFPEDEECPDSAKEEALHSAGLNGQESLEDCSIRFEDLELGECIKVGRRCKIYRARWHGDVFVHLFGELVKRPDREGFWRDVAKLCRIRHENINLFMGACTMTPNLAVITRMVCQHIGKPFALHHIHRACHTRVIPDGRLKAFAKSLRDCEVLKCMRLYSYVTGKTLFEHIHMQREKMTLHTRVQILQGVAQGMGYLHAKGIVLRKLNTANIFLCPRVKVSAIDFSLPEARYNRKDFASIPRGHLTYVAPEMLSTLRVIPPRLVPTAEPSPETDVFAFGTIMYEVLGGSYPYPGFPPESVIWSVCSGHRQNLASINCTIPLKDGVSAHWTSIRAIPHQSGLCRRVILDQCLKAYAQFLGTGEVLNCVRTLIEDCWSHEPLYRPDFPEISKELHRNSPQYKRHSSSEPERLNRSPGALD